MKTSARTNPTVPKDSLAHVGPKKACGRSKETRASGSALATPAARREVHATPDSACSHAGGVGSQPHRLCRFATTLAPVAAGEMYLRKTCLRKGAVEHMLDDGRSR